MMNNENSNTYDLLSDWNPNPIPTPPTAAAAAAAAEADNNTSNSNSNNLIFQFHSRFNDSTSSSSSNHEDEDGDDDDYNDDHTPTGLDLESTNKRLDYMLQFLDRKLSIAQSPPSQSPSQSQFQSLPEFIGRGGGNGIFKLPVRAPLHPGRPPCLELRPHPLRETQSGRHLNTLVVVAQTQLWAGGERNVRVWDLTKDLYARKSHPNEIGTAPFLESVDGVSPTLCTVADDGTGLLWTGHRDGRIRCWRSTSTSTSSSSNGFKEALSWQAHRAPVLSLIVSSYGDLWSGSEGGLIRIWPWEAIEKSLSVFSTPEDRHLAVSSVERAYIDPRNQGPANAFSNSLTADVKHLLSDNTSGRVWSASYLSFALWDARTKELLKVFNMDGQVENRTELSTVQDISFESLSGSRKEKIQTPLGFIQRSRNAIMGAADAVRRVATKGAFGEDSRRIEALIVTIDGMIWTGCSNGVLLQWDGNGNRLQDLLFHSSAVCCFCTLGLRLWVGYASGTIHVLDLEGNLLGTWIAHSSPAVKLTVGAGFVFSLASHGGIRGWSVTSPGPVDRMLCAELAHKDFLYTRVENIRILAGTWNVAQGRASQDSLISWLGTVATDVSMVVVGLQEVEMGAGFLAMSAARETVGLEEGSSVGHWWLDMIGKTLDEGSTFERIGSRQLAGMLIAVWVRDHLKPYAGDVDAAAVPCGFGRAIGNKGAVGLRLRVFDRVLCFINCHFAAHVEAVARRNADFNHVYRSMTFSRPSGLFNAVAAGTSTAVQMLRGANAIGGPSVEIMPELSEADMIIFLGDFNYRLDGISYDEARDFISQRCFDWLREKDQLRAEMDAGNVFQGMREAAIKFPPTYKFERHQAGLAGLDSGEKKRIPAWCDRILYRDNRQSTETECSLECPIVSSVLQYEACMDVTDSDHKPVRCIFTVDIARVDESVRREEFGEAVLSSENINPVLKQLMKIPETIVSTNNIILQNQDVSVLRITNKCRERSALFSIVCEGVAAIKEDGQAVDHCPRGSFGFPRWLEVDPLAGVIRPDQTVEVSVRHEKFLTQEEFVDGIPQNWWCEDNRDKEVILVLRIGGSYMTETRNHRVRVRHCFSAKTERMHQTPLNPVRSGANLLHRSDLQRLSDSYDMVDKLRTLQSP